METNEQNQNPEDGVRAVVDYTSQLAVGSGFTSMNDKYCVLSGDVVTVNFSGNTVSSSAGGINAIVAVLPAALAPNNSNIFFCGFNHTRKTVVGCRIYGRNLIVNNADPGENYWIAVTYVK